MSAGYVAVGWSTGKKRYDAVRAAAGRIADTLTNNLGGIATIKAFTAESREVERVAVEREPPRRYLATRIANVVTIESNTKPT